MASKGGLNLLAVGESLLKEYQKTSTTQTKVIDAYLLYVLATALIQVVYCALVGTFPFNSFLAGFLSCVGVFALTVSLRLQVASEKVVEKAFGEYAFCNLVLFLVVFNFLG